MSLFSSPPVPSSNGSANPFPATLPPAVFGSFGSGNNNGSNSLFGNNPATAGNSSSTSSSGLFGAKPVKQVPKSYYLKICSVGDVEINLKSSSNTAKYLVSSHQLCTISPVFSAMLGPKSSFAEAVSLRESQTDVNKPREPYKLSLEEDNINAMAVLLNIIHSQTAKVPKRMEFAQLMSMAIICDKYNCASAVKPWDKMWMDNWMAKSCDDGFEDWLFISWVFAVPEVFEPLTAKLSRQCILSIQQLALPIKGLFSSKKLLSRYVPDSVIKAISEQRLKILTDMLERCRQDYQRYNLSIPQCTQHGADSENKEKCHYMNFASLHKGFQVKSLLSFNASDPAIDALSPETVLQRVKEIVVYTHTELDKNVVYGYGKSPTCHTSCNPMKRLLEDLDSKLAEVRPSKLEEFGRRSGGESDTSWEGILGRPVATSAPTNA